MIEKIFYVLKKRPLFFFQYVRTHVLFQRTRFLIWIFRCIGIYPNGISIGAHTRVQRLRCIRNEEPDAQISIGTHGIIYENAKIEAFAQGKISLGNAVILGDTRIYSRGKITIGDRFLSSWNTFIQDFESHPQDPLLRGKQIEGMCGLHAGIPEWPFPTADISIGDDVWMGANSSILKGAHIGSGCIIAAHAVVVAGCYPENSTLAGVPAKIISTGKRS